MTTRTAIRYQYRPGHCCVQAYCKRDTQANKQRILKKRYKDKNNAFKRREYAMDLLKLEFVPHHIKMFVHVLVVRRGGGGFHEDGKHVTMQG